ncbi:uncharacterized protein KGF55_003883 [Candida pseudojiufengensis]|uniref:uncharacterized protein n=1 Tax=Candida pseudojiufengensis TaxID=497109 RepID=UPI002225AFE1|nr:uncharacterized protein KGF55_003883 [Candida pseudojiufengensis]KAI5961912.1 hypothetical protein KGF55_003883 [Candida pseudojiufengensis]
MSTTKSSNNQNIEDIITELRQISSISTNKFMIITQESLPNSIIKFQNSNHFQNDQIEKIKTILGRATLTTIKPTLKDMFPLKLNKNDQFHNQLITQYRDLFNSLSQMVCKEIAKQWIKIIEPNKQALYPYKNSFKSKPSWWPRDVNHIEPDHLDKYGRVEVLINILRYPSFDLRQVKTYTFDSNSAIPSIIQEILYLAIYERCFFNEYREQDELFDLIPHHERPLFGGDEIVLMASKLTNYKGEIIMVRNMYDENLNDVVFGLNQVKGKKSKSIKSAKKSTSSKIINAASKKSSKVNNLITKPKSKLKPSATSRFGQLLEDHELLKSIRAKNKMGIQQLINDEVEANPVNEAAKCKIEDIFNNEDTDVNENEKSNEENGIEAANQDEVDKTKDQIEANTTNDQIEANTTKDQFQIDMLNNEDEVDTTNDQIETTTTNDQVEVETAHNENKVDPKNGEANEVRVKIEKVTAADETRMEVDCCNNYEDQLVLNDEGMEWANESDVESNEEQVIESHEEVTKVKIEDDTEAIKRPESQIRLVEACNSMEEDTQVDLVVENDDHNYAKLTAYGSYMFVEDDNIAKEGCSRSLQDVSNSTYTDDKTPTEELQYHEESYSLPKLGSPIHFESSSHFNRSDTSTPLNSPTRENQSSVNVKQEPEELRYSTTEQLYERIINQQPFECQVESISHDQFFEDPLEAPLDHGPHLQTNNNQNFPTYDSSNNSYLQTGQNQNFPNYDNSNNSNNFYYPNNVGANSFDYNCYGVGQMGYNLNGNIQYINHHNNFNNVNAAHELYEFKYPPNSIHMNSQQ